MVLVGEKRIPNQMKSQRQRQERERERVKKSEQVLQAVPKAHLEAQKAMRDMGLHQGVVVFRPLGPLGLCYLDLLN